MNSTQTSYGLLAFAALAVACSPDARPVGPLPPSLPSSMAPVDRSRCDVK